MDMGSIMKALGAWNQFKENHPKFPAFCRAVKEKGIQEGSVIEISITTPEGGRMETNLKVKPEDLEMLRELMEIGKP